MGQIPNEFFTMDDFDFDGRTVYLRLDLNSPINPATGEIMDFSRFSAHLETINELRNSKLVIVAHQSRPGKDDFLSLKWHAFHLSTMLKKKVTFIDQLFGSGVTEAIMAMKPGDIIMLENSRFYSEEVSLDGSDLDVMVASNIVRNLAPLFDYFVIDAFPAIHRPQITLTGFRSSKPNIAGRLIEKEIRAISRFNSVTGGNKIAILSGAKISESIKVAKSFLERKMVDFILVGGVVGNAFISASGTNIGKRSADFIAKNNKDHNELLQICRDLLKKYPDKIITPTDFILNPSGKRAIVGSQIPDSEMIADIGVDTIVRFGEFIAEASAIFMNGPMGMYEVDKYSTGTREVFSSVAKSGALSIAGGGHTLSALEKMDLVGRISHASTGGGALISYLSGEKMPVLDALRESKKIFSGRENGHV